MAKDKTKLILKQESHDAYWKNIAGLSERVGKSPSPAPYANGKSCATAAAKMTG